MVATQASRDEDASTCYIFHVLHECIQALCSGQLNDLRASRCIVNLVALLCQKIEWKAELYIYI